MKTMKYGIIKFLVILGMVFSIVSPITAYAAETNNNVNADGSSSTTITATRASSWTVQIPKAVAFGTTSTQTFNVGAYGNILADKTIQVDITSAHSKVAMTNEAGTASNAYATFGSTAITAEKASNITFQSSSATTGSNKLNSDYATVVTQSGNISFTETKAGSWSGTLTFDISLK